MDEVALEPSIFFRTIRIRELLHLRGKPTTPLAIARYLKRDGRDVRDDMERLMLAGLAIESGTRGGYVLTEEGEASIRWSAPPPPGGVIQPRWVGSLGRAICDHYTVEMRDLLRVEVGPGVLARSRFCYALYAKGWHFERIEEHLGLPAGWARRAVERWKRMRDELPPRTGAELRAWRERHGLTQREAALRLGVHRLTIIRAEQHAEAFSPRHALGRA